MFTILRCSLDCRSNKHFWLCSITLPIKNSRDFAIQSEVKPEPIVIRSSSHTFSRARLEFRLAIWIVWFLNFDEPELLLWFWFWNRYLKSFYLHISSLLFRGSSEGLPSDNLLISQSLFVPQTIMFYLSISTARNTPPVGNTRRRGR